MTDLARELLGRYAHNGPARSLPEMNDGLYPKWQRLALAELADLGHVTTDGSRCKQGYPRYAITESGRVANDSPALLRRNRIPDRLRKSG